MLDLLDNRWKEFEGGYRIKYDASTALKSLDKAVIPEDVNYILDELWNELHHQGDVGTASYYSVPHLIRIAKTKQILQPEILNLVITIEIERHRKNPQIAQDLVNDYENAIQTLGELGKLLIQREWNLQIASTSFAAIALAKKQIDLARMIVFLEDENILKELLEKY